MNKRTFFVKLRRSRTKRILCAFLALNLIIEVVSPTIAMALTSGPAQPEFTSFEPVATTDMVNDFTGDFTYNLPVLNIPGPDGGGYSMSLSYHSGGSAEDEASWVGFGWTLNPGAINRNKRGFADEHNNIDVVKYNKARRNWTQSSRFDFNIEYNSSDQKASKAGKGDKAMQKIKKKLNLSTLAAGDEGSDKSEDPADLSISLSHTIRYNNYSGFSIANGFGATLFGLASVNMNRSGGQNTFGFSVNPRTLVSALGKKKEATNRGSTRKSYSTLSDCDKKTFRNANKGGGVRSKFLSSSYNIQSYQAPNLSYSVAKYESAAWKFSGSVRFNPAITLGLQVGIAGEMNVQTTKDEEIYKGFGYMFSNKANTNNSEGVLYDYMIEKETTFDKHDKFLGIPFNTADLFSVTGNNVSGGFRMQLDTIGTYYPNLSQNITKIRQLSIELGIGNPFEVGTDLGVGRQKTEVSGRWPRDFNTHNYFGKYNVPQMRFTNDNGGEVSYNSTTGYDYDGVLSSTINYDKQLLMSQLYSLQALPDKKQSSSHIKYHHDLNAQHITGMEITDKEGGKSNYLQPVYTKNEFELTMDVDHSQDESYQVYKEMYHDDPKLNHTAIGQKIDASYANTYLLTSNTTFNYVDADGDGKPSDKDFGGWTKFDYKRALNGAWYRYRAPYNGLFFRHGRFVDTEDQTGSMSSGEKEIYYLKCIETKSHIAFFVTDQTTVTTFTTDFPIQDYPYLYKNNLPISTVTASIEKATSPRTDGLDAAAIDGQGKDPAANSETAKGSNVLQKLERIVLFSKSDVTYPITTTYFEYDYSLCPGIPNSNAAGKGKLTLKRVWTESNGLLKSKIAPYQFHYEYFHNYPAQITSKYDWAADFNSKYISNDQKQNPGYNPKKIDAWGSYMVDGEQRWADKKTGISQKTDPDFEPAAWQLKRIQLPSGGEIHIHYEQKDYEKVQNEKAMAMVSVEQVIDDGFKSDESEFIIDATDIEVGDLGSYANELKNYFLKSDPNPKIYYKFLYNYCSDAVPKLNDLDSRKYEFVSGYTTVNDITVDGSGIHLHLGKNKNNGNEKKDPTLPRYACYQQLLTNGGKNLGPNARKYIKDDVDDESYNEDPKKTAFNRVLPNTINMFADWIGGQVKNVRKKNACKTLNNELSYFKLPVFNPKKGGGIRVCRLISYDPGLESQQGDASVFGSEYIYKTESGRSSGVATNEPAEMREENALVSYMPRQEQFWIDKLMNGRDSKQFEGPVGESLLPGAQVIHSRIIIRNIHSGKSTTGYAINKYFTPSEGFEIKAEYSKIDKKGKDHYRKFNLSIPLGFFDMNLNKAWVTQGYLFTQNDMSGKIMSKAVYPGNYDPADFTSGKEPVATSKSIYNYSGLREKVIAMTYDKNSKTFKNEQLNPGTEEDYTVFESSVREKTMDFSIEIDLNIYWGPIALKPDRPTPSFAFSDKLLCQHVTSKVVSLVTHLKSVTNINNGVVQTTETMAYDKNTGDPVLTRTFDGYMSNGEQIKTVGDGSQKHQGYYYSLNVPAAWMYTNMGQKSKNTANTNQLTTSAGNVVTYGSNALYDKVLAIAPWSPTVNPLTNVVSASATVFKNNWFSNIATEYPAITGTAVTALGNFNYPEQTYVYKANVSNANAVNGKIYSAGVISATPFKFFDWMAVQGLGVPAPEWYSDSKITKYSPYGYPIEEKDVLNITSSAKFGYNDMLPVTVSQNAKYDETRFTDFEHGVASDPDVTKAQAHSGMASHDLISGPNYTFAPNYPIDPARGISVKLWLRSSLSEIPGNVNYGLKNINPMLKVLIGSQPMKVTMKPLAQTGEWTLYSADIKDFTTLQISNSGKYDILLEYNVVSGETVYVDDFRIQPLDASMNCSVYYPDHKLAVQFDDQHFGVFYEYNEKGMLVRKSIETERGRKLLQEQQYNTPLKERNVW